MKQTERDDERVYLELVAQYQNSIVNYLWRMVGNHDLAEDLTQETYLRAYNALGRLELTPEAAPRRKAWLYRIAHNVATDHLRRKARLQWLPLEKLGLRSGADPAARAVAVDAVHQALTSLTADQREVLLLFSHDGLDARTVAEILGISEEAARKRRQRAREAFMNAYEDAT